MRFLSGLGKVALGVTCIAYAPITGTVAAGLAVTAGAAGTGAAIGIAEGSATAIGTAIVARGVKEASGN